MKKEWLIFCFLSCLAFYTFGQLSKSQIKMAHNYFGTITNFPRYYNELNVRVAELDLETKNLKSALQTSDIQRIETIIKSIDEYERALKLPDSILTHTKKIDLYIQGYYSLIPNGAGIYGALKGTTEALGGIFGVGAIVSGILPNNLNSLTPAKKRKIQGHITQSSKDLQLTLIRLKRFIINYYLPKLESIDDQSMIDFEQLLESITISKAPLDYYTKHNRMLTEFYQRLYRTKRLTYQLSKSIDTFVLTGTEIHELFQEKEKVNIEDTHLQTLVNDMQQIKYLIVDLNNYNDRERYSSENH